MSVVYVRNVQSMIAFVLLCFIVLFDCMQLSIISISIVIS